MITSGTLMWLGTVALLLTFGGLRLAIPKYDAGGASLEGLLAFAMALVAWALFALHASGYAQLIGSGVVQRASTPSLMVMGVIGGALAALLLVDSVFRVLRA